MRRRRADHLGRQPTRGGISRRTFLGGAAAAVSLPLLEGMLPWRAARAASEPAPQRLVFCFVPNGIHMAGWTPETEGHGFELPPILQPLAPVRPKINVITGLANRPAIFSEPGDHARGTGAFLTCTQPRKSEGADIHNGVSADQVAAKVLGADTAFPSLQLATSGGVNIGSCDSGYSCAYSRNISWAGPSTPLPKLANPRVLFDRLFAGTDPALTEEELARRRELRKSVLDWAVDDAKRLQGRLGQTDRRKVEEYLDGVRELERRIDQTASGPACEAPDRPPEDLPFSDLVDQMHELMVVALQCDMTRVATFMLGNGGSNRSFEFIGVSGAHHGISHHQNDPVNMAKLQEINTWEVDKLSSLLQRMDAIEEPGGTLLDHSLVYWSSEIEDGNTHAHTNLPILLAGSAAGVVPTGRHVRFDEEQPLANLYTSMLQSVGVPNDRFGDDGTGPLVGLV